MPLTIVIVIARFDFPVTIDHRGSYRARCASIAGACGRAPYLHTQRSTMSALLASSFVGRVAAFKATKIQVRI
jgi:hypothetical protein